MTEPLGRASSLPKKSPSEMQASVKAFLSNPAALDEKIRQRFNEFATPDADGIKQLKPEEVGALAEMLAKLLQVPVSDFGEIGQMFYRFDFEGNGLLDEDEATNMCICMLRTYRDRHLPSESATVKLAGIDTRKLDERYRTKKRLGQGAQGAVYLCEDKSASRDVVVKFYDKSNPNAPLDSITTEFELLKTLQHPRIARYFDIFQDNANIYMVNEPYFGGDLSKAVDNPEAAKYMSEAWIAGIMIQVCQGVEFLHGKHVMHCDLKDENVMITDTSNWHAPQVVVIDFGLANQFNEKSRPGGTPGYMPPEVFEEARLWTPKGDVFSIGVMLFKLRTGVSPFILNCTRTEDVVAKTTDRSYEPEMRVGSKDLKGLVARMLDKDFRRRISLKEAMKDSFFADSCSQVFGKEVLDKLKEGVETTKLKQAVFADVASTANLAQFKELNDLFAEIDENNDGTITEKEARDNLQDKWQKEEIDKFIKAVMTENGTVAYPAFMGQLMAILRTEENRILGETFNKFDTESKGYLSIDDMSKLLARQEISQVLGKRTPEELMQLMDKDADEKISFEEFKYAMENNEEKPKDSVNIYNNNCVQVGDELMYKAPGELGGEGVWVPCTVTAIDTKLCGVQISERPDYWMRGGDFIYLSVRKQEQEEGGCRSWEKRESKPKGGCRSWEGGYSN